MSYFDFDKNTTIFLIIKIDRRKNFFGGTCQAHQTRKFGIKKINHGTSRNVGAWNRVAILKIICEIRAICEICVPGSASALFFTTNYTNFANFTNYFESIM